MPSSTPDHVTSVIKKIQSLRPKTVLDVGIGFGKWAFLIREYVEAWADRVHPETWEVKIHGIEAWEPYTKLPWISSLYNEVWNTTLQDYCDSFSPASEPYDLVIAGDVIEHLHKGEAVDCLETLLKTCSGTLILSIPLGENWLNNVVVDKNPYEKHKSSWSHADVAQLAEIDHIETSGTTDRPVRLYFLKGKWARPKPRVNPWYGAPPSGQRVTLDESPLPAWPSPNNLILHVHNMRRVGGTGNFVHDVARCFPEFQHVALCVNDPVGDEGWIRAVSEDMRTLYAPKLTPELIDDLNPCVVMLHNTAGTSIGTGDHNADWPYDWIGNGGNRYVIFFHHSKTYPLVPVDFDVFVSKDLFRHFATLTGSMKKWDQIPPCTDLYPFALIKRSVSDYSRRSATTAGKACKQLRAIANRVPGPFGPSWSFDHTPPGTVGGMPGYLAGFSFAVIWSQLEETWCRTVTESMAAGCVTIAATDGAIPEQIKDGKTGFLFSNEKDLAAVVRQIESMTPAELAKIAAAGRDWATEAAGFGRLRQGLYPHLMRAVLSSA